jgi:hypothetical protein
MCWVERAIARELAERDHGACRLHRPPAAGLWPSVCSIHIVDLAKVLPGAPDAGEVREVGLDECRGGRAGPTAAPWPPPPALPGRRVATAFSSPWAASCLLLLPPACSAFYWLITLFLVSALFRGGQGGRCSTRSHCVAARCCHLPQPPSCLPVPLHCPTLICCWPPLLPPCFRPCSLGPAAALPGALCRTAAGRRGNSRAGAGRHLALPQASWLLPAV